MNNFTRFSSLLWKDRNGYALSRGVLALCSLSLLVSTLQAETWLKLYDVDGNEIEAQITEVIGGFVTIERRRDKKSFTLSLERLSEKSQDLISEWSDEDRDSKEGVEAKEEFGSTDYSGELSKRLYSRSKDEIEEGLDEILDREAEGFADEQKEAVNVLNAFRFACGVPPTVKLDKEKITGAVDAANACQEHGSLSHDLGRSTNKCNLHQGGRSTLASSVVGYIRDSGDNNRERRGHRRWCLNPRMGETGFGASENERFSAMWSLDQSKSRGEGSWAYPGKGLFPLEYLHGNGWSLYLTESAPEAKNLKVEVYRLKKRPEKPFNSTEDIPGKALPVPYVHTYQNTINFEPTEEPVTEKGIYYVRIKGRGVKEGYVVELY